MEPFALIVVVFLLAFLVETLVEAIFGTVFEKWPVLKPYKWTQMYIAMIVGVVGAFIYKLDLVALLSGYLGAGIGQNTFGVVLTGLAIGRGSNYLHDLVSQFFKPKA
jgi:hypothetical protein